MKYESMSDYQLSVHIALLAKDIARFGVGTSRVKHLVEATSILEERLKNKVDTPVGVHPDNSGNLDHLQGLSF